MELSIAFDKDENYVKEIAMTVKIFRTDKLMLKFGLANEFFLKMNIFFLFCHYSILFYVKFGFI